MIDKPLHFLGFAPSGRFIGHTLFASLVAFSFTYFATKDRKKSAALFVGHLSHFLADLCHSSLPLFYPFISYRFPVYPFGLRYTLFFFLTDLAGILIMVFIYFRNERFRAEVKGLMRRISGYFLVHFL